MIMEVNEMDAHLLEEKPCTAMERRLIAYAVADDLPYNITEVAPGERIIVVDDSKEALQN